MMNTLWNRARERREGDSGFTLVELLVVVVIIGILVAIAIPVFLSQREKAWTSAVESDVRNGAPIAETFYADNGTYQGLTTAGMLESDKVDLSIHGASAGGYCIQGVHASLSGKFFSLDSTTGQVKPIACP
jgi:type IV pilus assembly protein PilA